MTVTTTLSHLLSTNDCDKKMYDQTNNIYGCKLTFVTYYIFQYSILTFLDFSVQKANPTRASGSKTEKIPTLA